MTSVQPHLKSTSDQENAIVKLVNRLLLKAIEDRAADLYFEPQAKSLQIRIRKDGILQTALPNLPQDTLQPMIDYLKLAAEIDLARPAPQQGIIHRPTKVGKVEILLTTLPGQFGDIIHAKLAYGQQPPPDLQTLVVNQESLTTVLQLIQSDRGLILIAGERDTGKSTTVYSCLAALNHPRTSIYALDRQVKYTIPGITQIRIGDRESRERVIQTCLEQNPDILFLGAIDSLAIAQTAIQAVSQGCLVFATIDARDGGSAIERLINWGLSPAEVYTATLGVIAQKLVNQICPQCRVDDAPAIEDLRQLGISSLVTTKRSHYYRACSLNLQEIEQAKLTGKLCPQCQGLGYSGRIGLYEILPITERLKSSILQGDLDSARLTIGERINMAAQEAGMRSFLELAVNLFRSGKISLVATKGCIPPKTLLQNQLTASDLMESDNLLDADLSLDREAAALYWQQEATDTKTEYEKLLGELEKYQQQATNFEQRLQQSRLQIEQSTRAEIALQLLSVVDVIELARNSIKPQTDREAAIQKGYLMLENKILTSFREIGIQTIETKGRRFESHLHEIIREEVTDKYLAGTIIEEFKRGYILGDRVLRLAQVKVAVASTFL